jgi:prepilin-type processing-associated H-X9-DG protein
LGSAGKPQPLALGLLSLPPGPLFGSYQYRGGLTLDDRGDVPVAADFSFLHSNGADVLFLDGHTKFIVQSSWVPVSHGPFPRASTSAYNPLTPSLDGIVPTPPPPPAPHDYGGE